jgi:competence protein ComFC
MFIGLFEKILDLIYQQKCVICSCAKDNVLLCKNCAKDVEFLSNFPHKIYNKIPVYSACLYKTTIKKLIQLLKFNHKKKVSYILAQILFDYFKKLNLGNDFIIIYPDSFCFKNYTRGYEHMYLIAKEFSFLSGLKFYKHAIKKVKNTVAQYKAKDRHKNIKGSFEINKKFLKELQSKKVLLIDDIITSGATIEEIINLLQENNINDIVCLTISKAV